MKTFHTFKNNKRCCKTVQTNIFYKKNFAIYMSKIIFKTYLKSSCLFYKLIIDFLLRTLLLSTNFLLYNNSYI